jgi:uncharacterized membrane protein HdeD (DUF308 family)/alpha-beta hydrolase superfamily lysophospholipase
MDHQTDVVRRRSRIASLLIGVVAIVLGLVLLAQPFTSVALLVFVLAATAGATGVERLLTAADAPIRALAITVGLMWIALAAVIAFWPGLSVRGLALAVGVGLVIGGLGDLAGAVRGSTDERLAAALRGAATLVFGVTALAWPDVTLLVVAVVFGARTVLFGLSAVVAAVRPATTRRPASQRGVFRRLTRVVATGLALLIAVALAFVTAQIRGSEPVVDDFYAAPDPVGDEPGILLRAELFERGIPPGADAWRILYTTTRDDGVAAVASGLVVAPSEHGDAPSEVIAWAHGTTGVDPTCAPSVLEDPFDAGAFFALDQVLDEGWTLVATDYVGLGTPGPHPYLIGEGEGRSVLDAVRAARQLDELDLADRTVVWGHSQGGHAALWTGILAPDYAPDVNVEAVAALAPASDLHGLLSGLETLPGGSVFATYMLQAYAAHYPDVELGDYVRSGARVSFDEIARRCLAEPAVLTSILTSLGTDWSTYFDDLLTGPLLARLEQNTPSMPIEADLLIGQGETDPLVLPEVQEQFVRARCANGDPLEYRTYPDRDHVGVVAADSPLLPELIEWTQQRLDGLPAADSCADDAG